MKDWDQEIAWHALSEGEVFEKLRSTIQGLNQEQVAERQETVGKNKLPGAKPPTLGAIVLRQFLSPLIYILLAAGSVSLAIGETTDAAFIFAVIMLNAGMGAYQEWKAEKSAAALQSLLDVYARVVRDGVETQVPADELVPGDVVFLESGYRVPADLRLIQVNGLAVDESLLTGESVPTVKSTDRSAVDLPVSERSNMALAGTTVNTGRGVGVVVATGLRTEVGKIAGAVTLSEMSKPPLVLRMERFSKQISLAVLGACVLLVLVALAREIPLTEVFFMAVALAVSAVPEGLPVAITIALSVATLRMLRRNVIVRRLTAVEALGSCTCVASDKTGTLTVNKQTVKLISLPPGEQFTVSGEGYAGEGEVAYPTGDAPTGADRFRLEALAKAGILCNEAVLLNEDGDWTHHGDAVDVALLALGYKLGFDPEALRREAVTVGGIPFEPERRYAARIYREEDGVRVAVKGAIEAVLPFCRTMLTGRGTVAVSPEAIEKEVVTLSENGYRVLAVAAGVLEPGAEPAGFDEQDMPPLTLLGLVGLIDPLRPEVKPAVEKCKRAGIGVLMVTGDHPATALAIARELGIADS
ncbi:MAG: HAD-IC family P-type ATPase, partial [Candidatus Desulforudis sp.]|nr:HAD-IC family P-type ATPase [Desulforudis sp.]